MSAGNLLINGAFLPSLWTRLEEASETCMRCPVGTRTFAADRWAVRYDDTDTAEVQQARASDVPPGAHTSLEIRGADGVRANVYVGQTIEAEEAPNYRSELQCTAWFAAEHPTLRECAVGLVIGQATARDVFDSSVETIFESEATIPVSAWTRLDFPFDAKSAASHGLRVEWKFPATFLNHSAARVRLAAASLSKGDVSARTNTHEILLARRFCQRHSARTVNAIGRALVVNPHELHFQFAFPEMRVFPAITLPQNNEALSIFSLEGQPQTGFRYDVPHCARGSAIIRATKWNHGLHDGYLAFRGYRGAILLEAEL